MGKIGRWRKMHPDNTRTLMQWINEQPERRGLHAKYLVYSWDASTNRWAQHSGNYVVGYFPNKEAVKKHAHAYMRRHPNG